MTTTVIVLLVSALAVILLAAFGIIKIACESCNSNSNSNSNRAPGFIAVLLAVGICSALIFIVAAVDTANHVVETKIHPKVDTTIVIQNGVSDTTYTYNFWE